MKIVFASTNTGKIRELNHLLETFQLTVIPQSELGVKEIPETGSTFEENALIKARHASRETGLPAIADDSGLEVQALQGQPGIYSARYAGEKASSQDNINKLLRELSHEENRTANFHCVLVYLDNAEDPNPIICHGVWSGEILTEPRGEKGFGYDPVFFDPEYQCSAAELPLEIKNRISHRGKALRLLIQKLSEKQKR
jgi:XTP/dITP diphosphohydrolase